MKTSAFSVEIDQRFPNLLRRRVRLRIKPRMGCAPFAIAGFHRIEALQLPGRRARFAIMCRTVISWRWRAVFRLRCDSNSSTCRPAARAGGSFPDLPHELDSD